MLRSLQQPLIVRVQPYQYIHVLDNNTNVTRVEVGPQTFTRQEHETVVAGPLDMVTIPPRHYCIVANPVVRAADGSIVFDRPNQPRIRTGDKEIRMDNEPFPLYFGERLIGKVQPIRMLEPNTALHLVATRDFGELMPDGSTVTHPAGEEWLFKGPGAYYPHIEVEEREIITATIVRKGEALQLRAKKELVDSTGVKRQCDETWLMRTPGAYIPSVYEKIVQVVPGKLITDDSALHLFALKTFTDAYGVKRNVGDEWLVTPAMSRIHIPDVYEKVVGYQKATVLCENEYCVVLNPFHGGKHQLGTKEVREGRQTFFLYPGESLEDNRVKQAFVLSPEEGLLLRAVECVETHQPGDRWMVNGPMRYVPPKEVEVLERRHVIQLDETEGIYVRDIQTGHVREEMGKSYMLKANEELCEKELAPNVERLLSRDVRAECKCEEARKAAALPLSPRDKSHVVTLPLPFNSACQVYDYKENKPRVILGPSLVKLGYNEQFTVLSLSGGKPKRNKQIEIIVLLLGPDFTTDIVDVDTSDHAKLQIRVSYNYQFFPEKDNLTKLFAHPDFIGDICKAMASRIRAAAAITPFDKFHKNSAKIIRDAVFQGSDKAIFPNNSLQVVGVDVQSVTPTEEETRRALMKTVQLAIQTTTEKQDAEAKHKLAQMVQKKRNELNEAKLKADAEIEQLRTKLLKIQSENQTEEATGKARAEASARAVEKMSEAEAELIRTRAEAEAKGIKTKKDLELKKRRQQHQYEHKKSMNALEVSKKERLADIEKQKFKRMVDAIGAETLSAIAAAGPKTQAEMLKGLGLKSVLITDGSSPINLLGAANGLIAQPQKKEKL